MAMGASWMSVVFAGMLALGCGGNMEDQDDTIDAAPEDEEWDAASPDATPITPGDDQANCFCIDGFMSSTCADVANCDSSTIPAAVCDIVCSPHGGTSMGYCVASVPICL
jgi:hypothetical protein